MSIELRTKVSVFQKQIKQRLFDYRLMLVLAKTYSFLLRKTYNPNLIRYSHNRQKPLILAVFVFYDTRLQDNLQKTTRIFSCKIKKSIEHRKERERMLCIKK